jgi:hypothetical protein
MQETTVDGGFFCVLLENMNVLVADVMEISVLQRKRGVAKEERCCKGGKVLQRRKGVAKEERCCKGGKMLQRGIAISRKHSVFPPFGWDHDHRCDAIPVKQLVAAPAPTRGDVWILTSDIDTDIDLHLMLVLVAPPLVLDVFDASGQPRQLRAGGRGLPLRLVCIAQYTAVFNCVRVNARIRGIAIGGRHDFSARAPKVLPVHEAFNAEDALVKDVTPYQDDWVVDGGPFLAEEADAVLAIGPFHVVLFADEAVGRVGWC